MKKSINNFILTVLIGSAIIIAGLSLDAEGKSFEENYSELSFNQSVFSAGSDNHNSEFWSKFRESVMPDEKNPSSNFTGNDNPNPEPKKPNRNAN